MKKAIKFFGNLTRACRRQAKVPLVIIALAAITGLMLAGCPEASRPPELEDDFIRTGTDPSGRDWTLVVYANGSRVIHEPGPDSVYELTVIDNGTASVSTGTVTGFDGGLFTLSPSAEHTAVFYISVDETKILFVQNDVTLDDNAGAIPVSTIIYFNPEPAPPGGNKPKPKPPTHTHNFTGAWVTDAANHWKVCAADSAVGQKAAHVDANTDDVCDVCGYDMTVSTPTAPGAPTAVSATAGNAQASVTFAAPASNGGSAITGYTVTSSPGGFTGAGTASPITVTGLTNGTAYTFTVTATNSVGTSAPSSASSAVTPAGGGGGTYTVTYNGNTSTGGTAPTDSGSPYSSGDTVTVLGNTGSLVKTGNTFAGWNTAANGSGTPYAEDDTFTISANTTLYAQWIAGGGAALSIAITSAPSPTLIPIPNTNETSMRKVKRKYELLLQNFSYRFPGIFGIQPISSHEAPHS